MGNDGGDAFVVAFDGSRAGIIWEVGESKIEVSIPPNDRWGVFHVGFARRVHDEGDWWNNSENGSPSFVGFISFGWQSDPPDS